MWESIAAALGLITMAVSAWMIYNSKKNDAKEAAQDYANEKAKVNNSADDREDIAEQRKRIEAAEAAKQQEGKI